MWSEKYRPASIDEMIGDPKEREKLLSWLKKWKRGAKAVLIVGPPGTGKTTTVHLAAKKMGLNLVELNASDVRTKDKLSKAIGEVTESESLTGARSLIFLDEVDGLAGRSDYGAVDFIREAVRKTENPIVMAANDPESDEVKKLGSVTVRIEFGRMQSSAIAARLREIATKEKIAAGEGELSAIAQAANGDVRAAVNFLQTGAPAAKDIELTRKESIDAFFDAADQRSAQKALRAYPGPPRDKLRDLFVSVVRARVLEERRAAALEALSQADIIMGEIVRGKDWRLLRYVDALLAADLWRALGDGGARYTLDAVPWLLQLRIWNDSKKLKDIGSLAGRRLWTSQRGFLTRDMPYVLLLAGEPSFREAFARGLGLEENYSEFLVKEAARSARSHP